jgi:hypothetical protein
MKGQLLLLAFVLMSCSAWRGLFTPGTALDPSTAAVRLPASYGKAGGIALADFLADEEKNLAAIEQMEGVVEVKVLDDVWESRHAEPFNVLGEHGKLHAFGRRTREPHGAPPPRGTGTPSKT